MGADPPEVFVICAMEDIARGGARPFLLHRLDEDGAARPLRLLVVRTRDDAFHGYVNACPHAGSWLNIDAGEVFTPDRGRLRCGRHGAEFEIESGLCVRGPCAGESLTPLALVLVAGDVCLCGIRLVEDDDPPRHPEDLEDSLEITIHP
ncbi:Rieske (2Fe-2S) protein [Paracraurococcus lichenis]|uniref:Rieske 2Fe-2S domain-containing protein n=1 Tax=Paracraurococcus lichenis TaxID=3064888 RepID=A0ABT9DYB8_9PROT|nr:Rieske 2Fe-2S domain-containing protein [Paracraurococcus sp. LOR1-02]MDO9708908.1 Rieske 2Fe-2S domain-containing protein [Paracraurococcus sp. LOR1-02]